MIYKFADAVLCVRKARGLTREQLADMAGVGVKTISKIENGNGGGVSIAVYQKIFAALDAAIEIAAIDRSSKEEILRW